MVLIFDSKLKRELQEEHDRALIENIEKSYKEIKEFLESKKDVH